MLTEKKRRVLLEPGNAGLRYELAEAQFEEGLFADAEKQLTKAIALDPGHDNARRLLSRVADRLGRSQDLGHPGGWVDAARRFAANDRIDDAILYAEGAARRDGGEAAAWLEIAAWCEKKRLNERALAAYGRALRLSQREAVMVEARDDFLVRLGFDGRELISDAPPGALADAAEALVDGRLSDAKRALAGAGDDDRASAHHDLLRARILGEEGDGARASAAVERAKKKDPELFTVSPVAETRVIGVLGWTPFGGAVSPLQAVAVRGEGRLQFTGNVGDTGREAGLVAYTCLKALGSSLAIDGLVATYDLHLHFTDIELGKEGLSSGLALTLAGLSAFRQKQLRSRLGATGAITLHGEVQRVDGIYEKAVAAKLAGLTRILHPRGNTAEVRLLPELVTAGVEWIAVTSLDEAISAAFREERS